MTEQQREEELLADLLDVSAGAGGAGAASNGSAAARRVEEARQPILTRSQERALLDAAKQAGTPTLAPQERGDAGERGAESFASEVGGFVRRYPLPSLLAGAALAFLLTRRRR